MADGARDLHLMAEQRVRAAQLMYTKGRRQLVELLADLSRPATMPELLEQQPRLTLSSVYRNMTDLETAGVVQKVIGSDERTRYELAEDLIGHHHHSICTRCGTVDDFVIPTRTEKALDAALAKALAESGFRPSGHRLDVIGICTTCAQP